MAEIDEQQAINDLTGFVMAHLLDAKVPFSDIQVTETVAVIVRHRVAVNDILDGNRTPAQRRAG